MPNQNQTPARDDTLRVVRRAINLMNQGWCQSHKAKMWNGWWFCSPTSPRATSFCIHGAIEHACWERNLNSFQMLSRIRFITGTVDLMEYNDTHSKAASVGLLRKAYDALADNSRGAAVLRRSAGL